MHLSPPRLLLLGLLLGGAAAWAGFSLSDASSRTASARPASAASFTLPAWSWSDSPAPPLLRPDQAAPALAAWLALRSPDGAPAPYRQRASALRALLLRLPVESFPHVLASLARSATDDDRRLRRLAFLAWLAQAPAEAARWAVSVGDAESVFLARDAVRAWAAEDPAGAAAWACALPDDDAAVTLAPLALAALAETDPARAIALARSRDDDFLDAVAHALAPVLGRTGPAGAVLAFGPALWRDGQGFWALRDPIAAWARRDPAAALDWLLAQTTPYPAAQREWIQQLGDRSPSGRRALAEAVIARSGTDNRAHLLTGLLSDWAYSDSADLLAWLSGLTDANLRRNLLERVNLGYRTNEPQKSLPLALALPEGEKRAERLSTLLGAWAQVDPDATLAWMNAHAALPGVNEASSAVQTTLLGALAAEAPASAIAHWSQITDPRLRFRLIGPIATAWGRSDPAAALQWAYTEQSKSELRSFGGHDELIYAWARAEPDAALRWMEDWAARLPDDVRDLAPRYLTALGGAYGEKAPRAATADLLSKIRDPELRAESLTHHVKEWLTKDPAAARAWLESTSALTPEQAAALPAPSP